MEPRQDRKVALLPGVEEPHIRLPPENLEAEQALLGSILVNNAAYHRVSEFLKGEHFANALHGRLYDDAARLIEKGQVVSVITLKTYLEQDEAMKEAGGAEYLANLAAASVHVIDAEQYGRVIHDLYLRRQLIALGHDVVNGAFKPTLEESAMEQIETAEKQLYDLASVGQIEGGFKPFRASLTEAMEAAEAAYHRAGQLTGVATGLFQLDQLLGGLHKSDLIILAGRPAMGKSSLATNIGFNAARAYREEHDANGHAKAVDGAVVGFFSLEMSAEQLATRMISEQAEIPSEKIRKGELISSDFDRVLSVAHELEHLNFFIDDTPALSIAALRTRARR
ncbi:MAG TPA: DnaB-like helicase C-terminal domain-containing protein, partial [Reyranella sp.]|nr:DnaB-like helicase C-terminal domain-containing protein [Reyranella sp.]